MRNVLPLLLLASLSHAFPASAQHADALGPDVRKYVRVGTPKVILTHVGVIDGTGAEPIPDRNVTIAGGKITAISAGLNKAEGAPDAARALVKFFASPEAATAKRKTGLEPG